MRVFESIVTGLEDILCFATAGPGAFDLFFGRGMAASDSFPILAIKDATPTGWVAVRSTKRPDRTTSAVVLASCTFAVPRAIMPVMRQCLRAGIGGVRARNKTTAPEFRCFEPSSAQEVERIEEHLRSD